MAQLVKLQDYISRYETDIYHYSARFVRLKKQQWGSVRRYWEQSQEREALPLSDEPEQALEAPAMMQKLKSLFQRKKAEAAAVQEKEPSIFETMEIGAAANLEELKQIFLDQLFTFQVKWASSTVQEKSFIASKYFHDERLKFFLQRLPDSFLLLYEPVLRLKKAPMELDVILLTPTEAWCLTFLEEKELAVYIGSSERFWPRRNGEEHGKALNPVLALNRMETVITQLFQRKNIDFPIRKAVISRNGFIDYPGAPFELDIIDRRTLTDWLSRMRRKSSPLKTIQLKAAKSVLEIGQTMSVRRPEWDETNDFLLINEAGGEDD